MGGSNVFFRRVVNFAEINLAGSKAFFSCISATWLHRPTGSNVGPPCIWKRIVMTESSKTNDQGLVEAVAGDLSEMYQCAYMFAYMYATFYNPALLNRENPITFFIKECNASYKYPIVVIISSSVEVITLDRLVRTSGRPVRGRTVRPRIAK